MGGQFLYIYYKDKMRLLQVVPRTLMEDVAQSLLRRSLCAFSVYEFCQHTLVVSACDTQIVHSDFTAQPIIARLRSATESRTVIPVPTLLVTAQSKFVLLSLQRISSSLWAAPLVFKYLSRLVSLARTVQSPIWLRRYSPIRLTARKLSLFYSVVTPLLSLTTRFVYI